jgi:hypothetical protein
VIRFGALAPIFHSISSLIAKAFHRQMMLSVERFFFIAVR